MSIYEITAILNMRRLGHRGRGRYRNRGRISVGFIDTDTDPDPDADLAPDGPISKMRIADEIILSLRGACKTSGLCKRLFC